MRFLGKVVWGSLAYSIAHAVMLGGPSTDILIKQTRHVCHLRLISPACGTHAHESLGNRLVSAFCDLQSKGLAHNISTSVLPAIRQCSCDSLIIDHVKAGAPRYALNLYKKSQELSLSLSPFTFLALLKGCTQLKELTFGYVIHVHVEKEGWLQSNRFIGTALIDMYAKCGMLIKAQEVFDKLIVRDVVSWTALIAGYAQHERGEEALFYFQQMQLQGVSPNALTYACALKACSIFGALDVGSGIHVDIERKDLLKNNLVVGTALVDMYAKCGMLETAKELFDMLPAQNLVAWNALATGYAQREHGEGTLYCFQQMQLQGIPPDGITFACAVKACGSIGSTEKGRYLHAHLMQKGMAKIDQVIGTALVDMYAKFGMLANAREVLEELTIHDAILWSALIAGYVQHKHFEEALASFERMQVRGFPPNAVTLACSLKSCGSLGAIQKGRIIHANILKTELWTTDQTVGNTLIDMYAKLGLLETAWEVFEKLPARNIVSWNVLITGYAQIGDFAKVVTTCERMEKQGNMPDLISFVGILNACGHAGLVDGGEMCFWVMNEMYGLTPNAEHYTCMINLLGRAGQLDRASTFIRKTPSHLNTVAWLTLLGACRKWGNAELGRLAFERAVQLDEEEVAAYICMSNIYVDCGVEEDIAMA